MKQTFLILFIFCVSLTMNSQDHFKQKELGFVFRNLDNFGLTFKIGSSKGAWRFNTLKLGGSNTDIESDDNTSASGSGFELSVGRELIRPIADNLEFRFGLDAKIGRSESESKRTVLGEPERNLDVNYKTNDYGFNVVIGFNYVINDKIILGLDILPGYSWSKTERTETDFSQVVFEKTKTTSEGSSWGLSNSSVQLSLAVRF